MSLRTPKVLLAQLSAQSPRKAHNIKNTDQTVIGVRLVDARSSVGVDLKNIRVMNAGIILRRTSEETRVR